MKDYSAYQGPVQEWEDFVNLTGFKNVPVAGIAAERLRNDTNAARTQAARKGLANSSKFCSIRGAWCRRRILVA